MTQRWIFLEVETSESYTVPINPDAMTSPYGGRQYQAAGTSHDPRGRPRLFMSPEEAVEWEFSGVVRTQAHNEALAQWAKKPGVVRLTDHLGRTFEVMFAAYLPTERRPTRSTPWRLRYVMKALVLRRIA